MNPFLSSEIATEHIRDLHEASARSGRNRSEKSAVEDQAAVPVRIRHFAERDIDAIRRLAALDSKPAPTGGVLVAEKAGELVAALPLDGRPALADPFQPTADVVALLQQRAGQLRELNDRKLAHRPAKGQLALRW